MLTSAKTVARKLAPHAAYRLYRQRKIAGEIAQYAAHEVTHSYGGQPLRIHLADPLAEGWYDHDWEQLPEIGFLQQRGALAAGDRVFDLGAHQGVVALMLAHVVGPQGSVVAVEAEPHNAEIASLNCTLNAVENINVLHAAAAEASGTKWFAEGLNGTVDDATARGNVVVSAVTVDELATRFGRPDLVFVDVEGYEGHVLDGAADTLANGHTSFFVEVHDTLIGGDPAGLVAKFADFERFVSPESAHGASDLEPYSGRLPGGRFFLVALADRAR